MPLALPVRTFAPKRLRRYFNVWAQLALGWTSSGAANAPTRRVHQSDGGDPAPALPYLSYTRMAGPEALGGAEDPSWIGQVPTSATVVVTAAAAGDATTLVINEARFSRTMLIGETTEDQRDALFALIAEGVEPVVCTATGADSISVSPEYPGDLQALTAVEGCTVTLTRALREVIYGQRLFRYRVQLHAGSDASDPNSGYIDIDTCVDALLTTLYSSEMTRAGATLQVARTGARPAPQRASVNSGGRIEQRAFFDVFLAIPIHLVSGSEPITIDSVAPAAIVLT